jgi:phosphate transport system substrate-binding protein
VRRRERLACAALTLGVAAATRLPAPAAAQAVATDITGAGATFPFPVYRRWIADYGPRVGVRINYLSVGSAEGMRLLAAGEVDFGATDREPTATELGPAACPRVAVPMLVGAVAVVYHLPDVDAPLRLDDAALRAIYGGVITRWNDRAIARQNPGIRLPARPIVVVRRGPGSGTSLAFAAYLRGGRGPAPLPFSDPAWKVGITVEGNEGVAAQVQQTIGAVGYVELAYATMAGLNVALLRNGAGQYARPTEATLNASVIEGLGGRTRADSAPLVLLPAAGTYPMALVTWLVLDPGRVGRVRGEKVAQFMQWALREGGAAARELEYVPLPPAIVAHYDSVLTTLSFTPCRAGRAGGGLP